eukprot:1152698-Pelagomonas_calceolata.AAC.4
MEVAWGRMRHEYTNAHARLARACCVYICMMLLTQRKLAIVHLFGTFAQFATLPPMREKETEQKVGQERPPGKQNLLARS